MSAVVPISVEDFAKSTNLDVWDYQEIEDSNDWNKSIKKALNYCDSMIALLNGHSFSLNYVHEELQPAFFDERYKTVLIDIDSDRAFSRLLCVLTKLQVLRIPKIYSGKLFVNKVTNDFISMVDIY